MVASAAATEDRAKAFRVLVVDDNRPDSAGSPVQGIARSGRGWCAGRRRHLGSVSPLTGRGGRPGTAAGAGTPALRQGGQAMRVLIIDDHPDTADMMATLVGLWGHETRIALDGPSGLALARSYHPDVVFLDITLPGMDGWEV